MAQSLKRLFAFAILVFVTDATVARADGETGDGSAPKCEATDAELSPQEGRQKVSSLASFPSSGGARAVSAAEDFAKAAKSCTSETKTAQKACTESCSASLASNKAAAEKKSSEIKGSSAANGADKNAASALELQADGFRKFIADCSPKLDQCQKSCKEALEKLDALVKAVEAVNCSTQGAQAAACDVAKQKAQSGVAAVVKKEKTKEDIRSRGGKSQECDSKLAQNKKNAEMGLGDLLKAIAAALGAANKNSANAASADPAAAATAADAVASLDCGGKDAATEKCVCQNDPRSCNSSVTPTSGLGVNASADSITSPDTAAGTSKAASSGASEMSRDPAMVGMNNGGGFAGGMGGGMGAGGGTASSSKSAETAAGSAAAKALAAGLYSGNEGGGGGGGGMGYDSESGDKNPKLHASGRGFVGGTGRKPELLGLTASGGRSNWEKVTGRYTDNTATFLRDGAAAAAAAAAVTAPSPVIKPATPSKPK